MIDDLYTAVAHYHLHAHSYDSGRFAGPGRGDFRMADRLQCNCLVLTFVSAHKLNVDFFRAGKVAVDLGTLQR